MWFRRMAIEQESPEECGYEAIRYNLSESALPDRALADLGVTLDPLLLCYGQHRGRPDLREEVARGYPGLDAAQVLITNGAAEALFVVAATLLRPKDAILVLHPNYPSNYEVPRSLGCEVNLLALRFEDSYELDLDLLDRLVTARTKLVSLTYPHNPTGALIDEEALARAVALAESRGSLLVVDETYRELALGRQLPPAASLSPRAVSISSLSKAYGLPGIRIGWIASQDRSLLDAFLATKEQINICNSILDEAVALRVLAQRETYLASARKIVQAHLGVVRNWLEHEKALEWVPPQGGAAAFPRIRSDVPIDVSEFYRILRDRHSTLVGPGHWFEQDDRSFRIGYGWPGAEELEQGLKNVSLALAAARRLPGTQSE
jgi:aspartate/methionine/tyrosine aminotransferase